MSCVRVFVYFLIVFICSSCSIPLDCFVYNNSGVTVEITKLNNGKIEYVRSIESGNVELLSGWELASYSVMISGERYIFNPDAPYKAGVDYVSYEGAVFKTRFIRVQLEADKKIYVLKANDVFPLKILSDQPEGYPVKLLGQK